jgi:acyl carrier protein
MNDLALELAQVIIDATGLEDVQPCDIKPDQPLFVEGLGLDSIDALELSVSLEANYGINISDSDTARAAFATLATLCDFVAKNRTK